MSHYDVNKRIEESITRNKKTCWTVIIPIASVFSAIYLKASLSVIIAPAFIVFSILFVAYSNHQNMKKALSVPDLEGRAEMMNKYTRLSHTNLMTHVLLSSLSLGYVITSNSLVEFNKVDFLVATSMCILFLATQVYLSKINYVFKKAHDYTSK
ncbi:hypothetical protein [Vibrio sp. D431a]|uniref:hypothetical protein n=1 Tax=Vibrio sp. D431a TaxID=2837388 RepID=UPI002554000A|nr:hypothetical protein [Vibrio sp. D431a]MDK9793740.1 hypothetical protein [Vibrio sp. D431a]